MITISSEQIYFFLSIIGIVGTVIGYLVGRGLSEKGIEIEKLKTERDMLYQRLCEWDEKQKYN